MGRPSAVRQVHGKQRPLTQFSAPLSGYTDLCTLITQFRTDSVMRPIDVLYLAVFGAFLLGHYWWWLAMRRLSSAGQDRFWRILLWSKMLAGPEAFTVAGWRYCVRARWAFLACLILLALAVIVRLSM